MAKTERDLTRLPRWAQQKIDVLERNVEHWKAKANIGSIEETNTWVDRWGGNDTPLEVNAHVAFRIGGRVVRVMVDRRGDQELLQIQALDGRLALLPHVTNVVHVKVVGR